MLRKVAKGRNRRCSTPFSLWQSVPRMKAVSTPRPEALGVWERAVGVNRRDLRTLNITCLRRRRSFVLSGITLDHMMLKCLEHIDGNLLDQFLIHFSFICPSCLFPQYFKRSSQPRQGNVCESSFAHCNISTTPSSSSRGAAKHHRYNSYLHTRAGVMLHWRCSCNNANYSNNRQLLCLFL